MNPSRANARAVGAATVRERVSPKWLPDGRGPDNRSLTFRLPSLCES